MISDTHCKHGYLDIHPPEDVDMVIHAGDASTTRDLSFNEAEFREFLAWFSSLPYQYKVFVPGNHDTSFEAGMHKGQIPDDVHILVDETIVLGGLKIFGSPYTPAFGHGWAYNHSIQKSFKRYRLIEEDTDIVITHGPPKGILDITNSHGIYYERTGDKHLLNRILEVKPQLHIFGHLHDEDNVYNSGVFYNESLARTKFVNASVLNLRHKFYSNGHLIEI
jgi:Icc-related predicted phosphoesterase